MHSLPEELLGLGALSKDSRVLSIGIEADAQLPIQSRVELLREFLIAHKSLLQALPDESANDVFLGWSPLSPQEALTIDRLLLRLLADLQLELVFDTYSD